jgi:hypothetical protein
MEDKTMKYDNCKNCQNRNCEHFGKDREFVCINGISCKIEKAEEEKKMTYLEQIKEDIRNHIEENYTNEEISEKMENRDEFEEMLNDELWTDDNVTGNGSGSYTFDRSKAQEFVLADIETVQEALREFCVEADTIAKKFLESDWEYFDVTARCYVLSMGISEVLDEIEAKAA